MKILAIDDQQLIRISVKKKLTELGYEVETANSNEDGILLYNSFNPDLVLLDMNMPEMSGHDEVLYTGIEVVKFIRLFMRRDTPIIVMSGNTDESVINENYKLGVNHYLKKPASLEELAQRIEKIIGLPKQIQNLQLKEDLCD
jgi:CheY-like chemotaxis protein